MLTRQREVTFRFLAEPTDVNFGGKVHGGAVMKWIDQASYACAVAWSGRYCVTVYVGGIRFFRPIFIGNMVNVRACLIHTGKSSMHIAVDVSATDLREGSEAKTTHCIIVLAAVDEHGKPVEAPPWTPQSEDDKAQQQYAMRLTELRKGIEEEMKAYHLPQESQASGTPGVNS